MIRHATVPTVPALLRPFLASADRWGVSHGVVYAALLTPLVGLVALPVIWLISSQAFRMITNEDGVIEYLQFAAFVASAVLAGWIARGRWVMGHRVQALLFAAVCIGLVLISGEEISWGQRILGYDAPEALREINEQDEMTFHNIGGVLLFFNVGLLLASLYAIVAEPIGRSIGVGERWADADILFSPPLFLASAFAVMAVFRAARLTVLGGGYGVTRIGEWAELCFAVAVLAFLFLAVLRLRERAVAASVART